jgi:chemotaxis protein CheY-P-specific phosphatase CheC
VFFEVEGALGGVMALLISTATRDRLVEHLVGGPPAKVSTQSAESALREAGNILVSQVVSAMADTLGVALLPSIPLLALEDAPAVFASLLALREAERPSLRVETEISDRLGEVRALLVFVPDHASVIAAPEGF